MVPHHRLDNGRERVRITTPKRWPDLLSQRSTPKAKAISRMICLRNFRGHLTEWLWPEVWSLGLEASRKFSNIVDGRQRREKRNDRGRLCLKQTSSLLLCERSDPQDSLDTGRDIETMIGDRMPM